MSLPNGLQKKTRDQIKLELESAYRSKYGTDIDVSSNSVFGQEIAIKVDEEGTTQDQMQAVYDSGFASSSTGTSLTNVCALIGVNRKPATLTEVFVRCYGTASTSIAQHTIFETTNSGVQVETKGLNVINQIELSGTGSLNSSDVGSIITQATSGATGTIVTFGTKLLIGSITGTFDGTHTCSVPSGHSWTPNATPLHCVDADCQAMLDGPSVFVAGSITKIVTPVAGLNSVNNVNDNYLLGSLIESDPDLLFRYGIAKRTMGGGSTDAIRDALLALPRVTEANVWTIDDDATIPDNKIECVVADGVGQDIIDTIYKKKCASTGTHGNIMGTSVGSDGVSHVIKYSTPTDLETYVTASVWLKSTVAQPSNLVGMIRQALFDSAPNNGKFLIGSDLHASKFVGVIQGVHSSIINVEAIWLSTSTATPTGWVASNIPCRILTLSGDSGFVVGQTVTASGVGISVTGVVQAYSSGLLTLRLVSAGDFLVGGTVISTTGTGTIVSVSGYTGVSSIIGANTKQRVKLVGGTNDTGKMQINLRQVSE